MARGKKVFIGIDVPKESWQVTAISEGEELFHGRIPGGYLALRKLLERFVDCQVQAAYEGGPWRLGGDVIDDAVDPADFVDDAVGNFGQKLECHARYWLLPKQ